MVQAQVWLLEALWKFPILGRTSYENDFFRQKSAVEGKCYHRCKNCSLTLSPVSSLPLFMKVYILMGTHFQWHTEEGGLGCSNPPPEILKFWQSWAKLPVLWKICLWQPNKNTGFTHLQIEWNPWFGGLPPPDPCSLCPLSSTEFVEPPRTKFLGTPLDIFIKTQALK
jgi:hypothetical protein